MAHLLSRVHSPKHSRGLSDASGAASDHLEVPDRHSSRTLFTRKKARLEKQAVQLPDLEKTNEEFERDWGITKEEEERRLVEFRRKVEELVGQLRPFFDDYYLRRFLRARGHDITKAREMFLKHLQWREAQGIDTILQDFVFQERDAFLTLYPQGYHKTDKLGRPVYIQHLGQINIKALNELTTEERMIKFHVQEYERALKYIFPACSKVAGRHIDQTLTILDLQGVGLRHLTGDVKRIISMITRVDQDNYPETLGKTLIINAPSIFKMIWGLVKPMVDVRTQAKIEVCPSNYLPVLLKWVDAENIPEYLGGKSKGSLLDDVGPWKDPKLIAEIDADIRRRDGISADAMEDKASLLSVKLGDKAGEQHDLQQPEAADGRSSDGEEFHDVVTRRNSMMSSAGSSAYLSADEEYYTPKAAQNVEASQPSFTSDKPFIVLGTAAAAGASASTEPQQQVVSATTPPSAAPSRTSPHKAHAAAVGEDHLIPSPPLQIPILARVRSLEEKIPAVERPIKKYLPPGPAPSRVIGEGTLLSRVAALERAMDTLLKAQDFAVSEAKRKAELQQQQSSRGCCSCCTIM